MSFKKLVCIFALTPALLFGQNSEGPETPEEFFKEGETFTYQNDSFTVLIRYLGYPEERSARVAVESFELQLTKDSLWVSEEAKFMPSDFANLLGQGFAAGPVRMKIGDQKQIDQWQSVLGEAVEILTRIPNIREEIIAEHGSIPEAMRFVELDLGEVYSYPKKKPMQVRFQANFAQREYVLLIGETIRINDYSLEAANYLVQNIDRYIEVSGQIETDRQAITADLQRRLRGEN